MTKILRTLILVLLLCILLAGLFAAYSWHLATQGNPGTSDEMELGGTPTGAILTNAKITKEDGSVDYTTVSFEAANEEQKPSVYEIPKAGRVMDVNFPNKYSDEYFFATAYTGKSLTLDNPQSPYIHRFIRNESARVYEQTSSSRMANIDTTADGLYLAYNLYSGSHTYGTSSVPTSARQPISETELIILETDTGDIVDILLSSWSPQWSANKDFLFFIRPDGVFARNNITKQATSLIPFVLEGGFLSTQTMMAVSSDDHYLVIATPQLNRVDVYELNLSNEVPQARRIAGFNHVTDSYYTPVFSPDGAYFAVLTVDSEGEQPRIEIRTTSDSRLVKTILFDTDLIDVSSMSLTDWVQFE